MQATELDNARAGQSETPASNKKRANACGRCRRRKVRCDGHLPDCGNCRKAGLSCEQPMKKQAELQQRIAYLEGLMKTNSVIPPLESDSSSSQPKPSSHHVEFAPREQPAVRTPGPYVTGFVQSPASSYGLVNTTEQQQSIAHEVGMLSLANAADPKYLGPSSGLIFAKALTGVGPQGLSSAGSGATLATNAENPATIPAELPPSADLQRFIGVYFETFHQLYPFLDEAEFLQDAEKIRQEALRNNKPISQIQLPQDERFGHAQLNLVLFLGATILQFRLGRKNNAYSYMVTAMIHIQHITLHDNLRGLQVLLLLLLASLQSSCGIEAWYLRATVIAGCIDLGFQRKINYAETTSDTMKNHNLRSGIFWSAYSLDRTLSVVLGRPLTLRDEACDIGFPGDPSGIEITRDAVGNEATVQHTDGAMMPAITSFRFDRIVAEIKLMLYRVSQSPARFPWPTDVGSWQTKVHEACSQMIEHVRQQFNRLDTPFRGSSSAAILAELELKYHHTIMLLYRPSPFIQQPSALALRFCFESAMETIRIYSDVHRNGNLMNSYIEAHTIFISGISVCYCLLVSKNIRQVTPANLLTHYVEMVKHLLSILSKTWSVAQAASEKFVTLAEWTEMVFKDDMIAAEIDNDFSMADQLAQDPLLEIPQLPMDDDLDWENMIVSYDNTELLPDELKEIPDWFALSEWLDSDKTRSIQ